MTYIGPEREKELHPLIRMVELYCSQYDALREDNLDLPPLTFHKRYGLVIRAPHTWDILSSITRVVNSTPDSKVVIIFGSTDAYRKMHAVLDERVRYFSWHEIFTGIHTASTDVRYIQKSKQLLSDADITFFVEPPSLPEVMDQVCGQTANCLVVLSGGGV